MPAATTRSRRWARIPAGSRVTDFTLLVYKRGYVAYRSDRRFSDLGLRMDFAQTDNQVLLERWRNELSHARHLRFVGSGTAVAALTQWELEDASAELEGKRPSGEDLRPGRGEGPYVVAAQLLTEADIKARTKYDGTFETGPLSDEPDTATYSSQHFKALGRPETWDVAIRVWRLDPGKAQERYDELLTQLPGIAGEGRHREPLVRRERERHPRRRLPRRAARRRRAADLRRRTSARRPRTRARSPQASTTSSSQLVPVGARRTRQVNRSHEAPRRIVLVLALTAQAFAWEAETTQAGLAEQAALVVAPPQAARHARLRRRTVRAADDPARRRARADRRISTCSRRRHGSVPDARGRQTALAWIAAGAALADVPATHGANHFYDPATRQRLGASGRADCRGHRLLRRSAARAARARRARARLGHRQAEPVQPRGLPRPVREGRHRRDAGRALALRWPARSSRPARCSTCSAISAHPSRVRGDYAAHLEPLGGGPDDLGSRFERIAALAYGRLGVPAPSRVDHARAPARLLHRRRTATGLADKIAAAYFSPNTLPEPTRVGDETSSRSSCAPQPALPTRLNLMAASRDDGTTLRIARRHLPRALPASITARSSFSLDDDCMLEQVAAILPEVAAYETGLLDFLLRGELTITHDRPDRRQRQGPRRRHRRAPRRGRPRRAHARRHRAGRRDAPAARRASSPASTCRRPALACVAVFRGTDAAASRSSRSVRCRSPH